MTINSVITEEVLTPWLWERGFYGPTAVDDDDPRVDARRWTRGSLRVWIELTSGHVGAEEKKSGRHRQLFHERADSPGLLARLGKTLDESEA